MKCLLLGFGLCFSVTCWGQSCTHYDLSRSLLFETQVQRLKLADHTLDSCIISLTISSKQSRKSAQTITLTSNFLFAQAFRQCPAVRSYTTGKNRDASAVDNDYGDLIVADFNFDGQEDFAIKNDSGGNGGPLYSYYLQHPSGRFILDQFLTSRMSYFPSIISRSKKSLTVRVHANMNHYRETTYQLTGGRWTLLRTDLLPTR